MAFAAMLELLESLEFPYRTDCRNQWFQQTLVRSDPLETYAIDMMNASPTEAFSIYGHALQKNQVGVAVGAKMYYHGTSSNSAKQIIENGIDLSKSNNRKDFSNGGGFYLSDNVYRTVDWAIRKARGSLCEKGAVIAFKIPESLLQEQHLSLSVETIVSKSQWQNVVRYFRRETYDPTVTALLQNVKYIEGPVSKVGNLNRGLPPEPHDFNQLCICDHDFARRFGSLQNISFVIFCGI